jgi:glutamate dehydrogenase
MPTPPEHAGGAVIAALQARVRERLPAERQQLAADFIALYYRRADDEDLATLAFDDLYGAAMSHWQLAQQRPGGQAVLRIVNPALPEHGWQSPHTVIEIVNDDMPFLVDSLTNEINRQGLTLHRVFHPVLAVRRDGGGRLVEIGEAGVPKGGVPHESLIHAEVDRLADPLAITALRDGLWQVLADVRVAVADWQPMLGRLREVVSEIEHRPPPQPAARTAEDCAFLKWLADGNFTLLGYRCYDLLAGERGEALRAVSGSGLGLLRGGEGESASFAALPADIRALARAPQLLTLVKSTGRSTVHRAVHFDHIGIRRFGEDGEVIGEHRFLGLFTSVAYSTSPWQIPLLRRKVQGVLERSGLLPNSHSAKALRAILESYPRDELFQAGDDELYAAALAILGLGERQRTRLLVRRDLYRRFVSCLIFVPRDRYDTTLRRRIEVLLLQAFGGISCEHQTTLSESMLARLHLIVRVAPGAAAPAVDLRALEEQIAAAARDWNDLLADSLVARHGEAVAGELLRRYRGAFPAAYRETTLPAAAPFDIALVESAEQDGGIAVSLHRPSDAPAEVLRLKIVRIGMPLVLSDSMPMLENMGVRVLEENPFAVRRQGADAAWLHDFGLEHQGLVALPIEQLRALFHEAFLQVWRGEVENDRFNALVLAAGLDWRRIKVLRAYARYMKQAGSRFSPPYVAATLCAHPRIAMLLARLFEARFDPALPAVDRAGRTAALAAEIETALAGVDSLDDDRIVRQYLALIEATLRSSYFRRAAGGDLPHYLSFKFDPARIPGLPEPRPKFEIFVFSPRVEGVHLRGGHIARGGLRWSDRIEDYRTEVLGLVKAQMVKNAVIVPTGSKGGFVVKRPPPAGDREALLREGVACYETYLQGLLDLTDNRVDGAVVPPEGVVRHDGDDPYLVVAADKGTASFSDIANAVAARYRFWLGDAFASGGSVGYDHKKMGITARGAWESVKRHFRELGVDTQREDFTVVGIGDMSGDVFGNGMLLSPHIRLVAAFDHRHLFIDPNPDAAASFAERERLFALPRSSWDDYDRALISPGGGVWPRSAKSVALSPEARAALGIAAPSLPPAELIAAILRAPVDLLYNGGIGTYVKASDESHDAVGDRANDALRVDAAELRCRVVGEGGNLGFTQRARIEFAQRGGRIYTDAIDNSGGVDCSDHEVNIKILLGAVVAAGDMTLKQRDRLLVEMTDEVAALVLQDNVQQTRVLSEMAARAPELLDEQARYLRELERRGRLIRRLEHLPNDERIDERRAAGQGLCLPELAVLLAYAKMDLSDAVLASNAPDDAVVARALPAYFPAPLRERFAERIAAHPLRREIVATAVTNELVNRGGPTCAYRLAQETGADAGAIVRAWVVAREVFGLAERWRELDALPAGVPAAVQRELSVTLARQAERAAQWFLRRPARLADTAATIARFAPVTAAVDGVLDAVLQAGEREAFAAAIAAHVAAGVPVPLARAVAAGTPLYAALDLAEIVGETGRTPAEAAGAYFDLVGRLDLYWISRHIGSLAPASRWEALARSALRDDLEAVAALLTGWVFHHCEIDAERCDVATLLDRWEQRQAPRLSRYRQTLAELRQAAQVDWAMLSVLLRELKALAQAPESQAGR